MKIAVIGAGGVGGYFGARLAKAGHSVQFLARGAHLKAMRESGLRIFSDVERFTIAKPDATDDPARLAPADVMLSGLSAAVSAPQALRNNSLPEKSVPTRTSRLSGYRLTRTPKRSNTETVSGMPTRSEALDVKACVSWPRRRQLRDPENFQILCFRATERRASHPHTRLPVC